MSAMDPTWTTRARQAMATYRASGADLPFGDPLPAHGVAMEGYFWRFTDPLTGRVLITLAGVNRSDPDTHWSTLGLASHPNGFLRTIAHPEGVASTTGLGVHAGDAFSGTTDKVHVQLARDALLSATITDAVPWPRSVVGGSSIFQSVPGLNQYWHPWLLGGSAHGRAVVGDDVWEIDGWSVYAEKNWGKGGFPDSWWWGQAQGFKDPRVCVAFAGGEVSAGRLHTTVTALVVLLPGGRLLRLGDPVVSPVHAEVTDEQWVLRGRSAQWQVDVDAHGALDRAHVLPVPLPTERRNVPGAIEHLGATMTVTVRHRGEQVWQGTSRLAALEHGGIDRARAEVQRRGGSVEDADARPLRS